MYDEFTEPVSKDDSEREGRLVMVMSSNHQCMSKGLANCAPVIVAYLGYQKKKTDKRTS